MLRHAARPAAAQRRCCVVGLPSRAQMQRLSVKDLRLLAAKQKVTLSDCVEKAQMIDKLLGDAGVVEKAYQAPTKGTLGSMFTQRELALGGAVAAVLLYVVGKGLVDRMEAPEVRALRRAAAAGDNEAALELAKLIYKGAGTKQDPKAAFELLKAAAETGDGWALCELGGMYCRGDGVTQNHTSGYSYFLAAAAKGNSNAMFNLARLCEAGAGTRRDEARAEHWQQEADKALDAENQAAAVVDALERRS